ncbi:MAG TPA: 2Fe-2S iron-sulfur cluster-binding protein [Elusimicrobiota bacterium]|nr:2Fe-2S iron-sulfur cluster-binding protein [Elusimicrobiota bacterium]
MAERKLATFTLDGKTVSLPEGTPVIEAAKQAGLEIPHYCYHPALGNPGQCRLCMVEVEGMPKLQVSCRLPAKDGLVVRSNSQNARKAQASSMEFHLANHPLDCPVCDQAGECYLQDYYMRYGLYTSTVREDKAHKHKRVDIGEHVMLDSERCILCTRCVRFLDQVTGTGELGVFNRGCKSELAPYPGKRVDNAYSGNIIDVCPVGALTDKDFRFNVRVWYLDRTPSVCTGCARGCSIEVHSNTKRPWHDEGRRVNRLKPRVNPEVNGYWICDEGRYSYEGVDAKTRLRAASALEAGAPAYVPSEEAAGRVGAQLRELCAQRGPEGLAVVLSGTLSNEDLFAARRLFVDVLEAGHVLVRPGPDQLGEEDRILRRREKVPNHKGAELLGFGSKVRESSWDDIRGALGAGKLWGLYVIDRDPIAVWGAEASRHLGELPFSVYQGVHANKFMGLARWVLPSTSWTEEDATYTNFQGHVQRARAAVPPLGESRPDWAVFLDILGAVAPGESLAAASAQELFALLSKEGPFAGLSWESLGDNGARIREAQPA